jgi:hypothetical protein
MFRFRSLPLLAVAVLGCSDVGTAPTLHPLPEASRRNTTSIFEPDPPTEWLVSILSTSASVSTWLDASIDASMRYHAYHASIAASVTVRDTTTTASFTFGPSEKHTFFSFRDNHHSAGWTVRLRQPCGTFVDANITYEAWFQGLTLEGLGRYESDIVTQHRAASQSPCSESGENEGDGEAGSGGGGGGGTGSNPPSQGGSYMTCWWQFSYVGESGEILEMWLVGCWKT